jgi:hypothetical protein
VGSGRNCQRCLSSAAESLAVRVSSADVEEHSPAFPADSEAISENGADIEAASTFVDEAAASPEDALEEPSTAAEESKPRPRFEDPLMQQFHELWEQYSDLLASKGFYEDEPGQTVPNTQRSELGAIKRANLQMARDRIDILYSLPTDKLKALCKTELPYSDRKVCPSRK